MTSVLCLVTQWCLTLCNPMDCSLPARLLCPWGFFRQEYWSGLPCPPPGDPPNPGIEPRSPVLQADSLPSELPGKPTMCHRGYKTTRIPCAKVKLKKKIRWNNNEENFTESLSYVVAERSRCLGSHRCVTHGPTVRARSFWPKSFCLFFK